MNRIAVAVALFLSAVGVGRAATPADVAEPIQLSLQYQVPTAPDSGLYHRLQRTESWDASRTAMIVCDVWDSHHCYRAVQRVNEMAPRLQQLLSDARERGVTIIHAPSGCMEAYADHPSRRRAIQTPAADSYPEDVASWCYSIPAEEQADYPIDQTDGGEDDTPEEHAGWVQTLQQQGRDPKAPWLKQIDIITIDEQRDFISDSGKEIWNILQQRGIANVVLTGVHTNMCVLGRPFGLRRMALAGKNVVLMRDLTDTMYDPAKRPFVSHFTGTDLIIDHIERFVCPTVTSDQWIGGAPFRFAADTRPHVVMLISEPEYETERTLPRYALQHLGKQFRVSTVMGSQSQPDSFPGIEAVGEADVLLVSVRRRTPPADQMNLIRQFVRSGKPVVGIRTASHAFTVRGKAVDDQAQQWPGFDAEVFGGSYGGHHGNQQTASVQSAPKSADHPILRGMSFRSFAAGGSLYKMSPLATGATPLLIGTVADQQPEPVAWTFQRQDGGRSFYTSLGHPDDFENPVFQQLLRNSLLWAAASEPRSGGR